MNSGRLGPRQRGKPDSWEIALTSSCIAIIKSVPESFLLPPDRSRVGRDTVYDHPLRAVVPEGGRGVFEKQLSRRVKHWRSERVDLASPTNRNAIDDHGSEAVRDRGGQRYLR